MDTQAKKFFKKTEDAAKGQEKPEATRYKESAIIKKFLNSKQGIQFLIEQQKPRVPGDHGTPDSDLYAKIDNIIDFYVTWTNNFPVRKNMRVSKYEFLKCVENFCSKTEICEMFTYQLTE